MRFGAVMSIPEDHWSLVSEGEVLRAGREGAGMSRERLSHAISCTAGWLYQVETGRSDLSTLHIANLKSVLPDTWRVIATRRVSELKNQLRMAEDEDEISRAARLQHSASLVRDLRTIRNAAERQLQRLESEGK